MPNRGSKSSLSFPYITINAVFSKISMQSDCIERGLSDDLSAVKNKVYGEKSAESPVTYSLLLVMRNGD